MAIVQRSQVLMPGDSVRLEIIFRSAGVATDTDLFPQITIVSPTGGVVVGPTSTGVSRTAVGTYEFLFEVGLQPYVGVWRDIWQGNIGGVLDIEERNFVVYTTQMPAINTDGYQHLGDDVPYDYSQTAICNINILLKLLRARLNSRGKHKTQDAFGNIIYVDCDIFDVDDLVAFIVMSLSEFNEIPHFTYFTFDDTEIIRQFAAVLVQGASLMALSSQALIERGQEFQLTDNGIGFVPPTISEMLNSQWGSELQNWYEKVKLIKHNMKSAPIGLGTLSFVSGASPQIRRLRWLRERRIF